MLTIGLDVRKHFPTQFSVSSVPGFKICSFIKKNYLGIFFHPDVLLNFFWENIKKM